MTESGQRPARPGWAGWAAVVALGLAGSFLAWWMPSAWLDWQPGRVSIEPWRAFTAAWVHWSPMHLAANTVACGVLWALGWAARLPVAAAWAWLAAWPLAHLGLLLRPELAHYGGLSGVLHAGVAVAGLWLLVQARGARQLIGAVLALGLVAKCVAEAPWGPVLRPRDGWDIAIAPLAHSSGALAGFLCAAAVLAWRKNPGR